jgi:predicted pyridoxine 5'-phosphate oxidase superfamily flavin-nucleotide-binding protein
LPDGAGDFLAHQNLLVVGAQGDDGRLWASLFAGPRGFVSAPDDESVLVLARLAADDPVEPMTRRTGKLGLLAIDLETRIRLRLVSPAELCWPDYVGNSMLMTLGNIIENPHAALVFVDWATGTTLQLTGRAEVRRPAAGPRTVEFELDEAVYRPGSLRAHWSAPALSRFNPPVP